MIDCAIRARVIREGEMRKIWLVTACSLAMVLNGCGMVAKDLRHTGGVVGDTLDRRMFDASKSKQLVTLRSAILVGMIARAGTVYSRDAQDANAYVNYMVGAADEINILAGHIANNNNGLGCDIGIKPVPLKDSEIVAQVVAAKDHADRAKISADAAEKAAQDVRQAESRIAAMAPAVAAAAITPVLAVAGPIAETKDSNGCYTYAVNFESDVPVYERKLFRLAMAALPVEQARKFLDQVRGGNAFGAAIAAFKFATKSLEGLHNGAAVHRTGVEIVAYQVTSCRGGVSMKYESTVWEAARCLGLPENKLFTEKDVQADGFKSDVYMASFHAIMRNIRDSCLMISNTPTEDDTDLSSLKKKRRDLCNKIQFAPHSRWTES